MSKDTNIRGVDKIEIGLPGDGILGASLTEFKGDVVVLNSLSIDGGDARHGQQLLLHIFAE